MIGSDDLESHRTVSNAIMLGDAIIRTLGLDDGAIGNDTMTAELLADELHYKVERVTRGKHHVE